MNSPLFVAFYFAFAVNGSAENINNSAYYGVADRHFNTLSVGNDRKSAAKSFGCFKRNRAHNALLKMKRNLKVFVIFFNSKQAVYRRHFSVKSDVNYRPRDFNNRAFH